MVSELAGRARRGNAATGRGQNRIGGSGVPTNRGRGVENASQDRGAATTANGRAPPRGQWGDDGYDAYGDGQHRGSSSTGGGRGYAWNNSTAPTREFNGPAGGFVEGASGPTNKQHGTYKPKVMRGVAGDRIL